MNNHRIPLPVPRIEFLQVHPKNLHLPAGQPDWRHEEGLGLVKIAVNRG